LRTVNINKQPDEGLQTVLSKAYKYILKGIVNVNPNKRRYEEKQHYKEKDDKTRPSKIANKPSGSKL
jgi:hypothetical protein